jgi:hypothetical protein
MMGTNLSPKSILNFHAALENEEAIGSPPPPAWLSTSAMNPAQIGEGKDVPPTPGQVLGSLPQVPPSVSQNT